MCMVKFYVHVIPLDDAPVSSGNSSSTGAIIGGAVGGVMLLMIVIVLMCIVILCMRRRTYHKFLTKLHDNKNSTIIEVNNPSYDNTKPEDSDIPLTTNPSYDIDVLAKPYSKASEDEYNYVQVNKCADYLELEDTIKIDTNPSYGVTTGDRTTAIKSNKGEYDDVNHPKRDAPGYEETQQIDDTYI